jgi:hypothetical protein
MVRSPAEDCNPAIRFNWIQAAFSTKVVEKDKIFCFGEGKPYSPNPNLRSGESSQGKSHNLILWKLYEISGLRIRGSHHIICNKARSTAMTTTLKFHFFPDSHEKKH